MHLRGNRPATYRRARTINAGYAFSCFPSPQDAGYVFSCFPSPQDAGYVFSCWSTGHDAVCSLASIHLAELTRFDAIYAFSCWSNAHVAVSPLPSFRRAALSRRRHRLIGSSRTFWGSGSDLSTLSLVVDCVFVQTSKEREECSMPSFSRVV